MKILDTETRICFNGVMSNQHTHRSHNAHDAHNRALYTEAREMSLQLANGNRTEVREFVTGHATPAKLVLAIIRCLVNEGSEGGDALLAVVNIQSLLESKDV